MANMCDHFREFMVEGTKLNQAKLKENIDRSVMMVTALSPVIGYDKAAAISYYAIDHDLTLKQAALAKGVSEELYDRVVEGGVREVVIATNPTTTGEATALHIADALRDRAPEAKVTRLASGLPVGSDLEYADELTLGRALAGRRAV